MIGSVAIGLVGILALECGLRLGGVREPHAFRFQSSFPAKAADTILVTHPRRVYALAPESRASQHHAGRYANGAWPHRGRPPLSLATHISTVVFVGDSCMYGTAVDTSQTLPERTAVHLARHGAREDRVQCLNLGVPGYSVVQVADVVEEALETLQPDWMVFYAGAWNDQAPAVDRDDVELMLDARPLRRWFESTAIGTALGRLLHDRGVAVPDADRDAKPRVPEAVFERLLSTTLERVLAAGVRAVVIAPAHPARTAEEHPRTRRDAATTARVGRDRGAIVIDAQAALEASGVPEASRFVDNVHLSPESLDVLGALVAAPLAQAQEGLGSTVFCDRVDVSATVQPDSGSVFGDQEVVVTVSGVELVDPVLVIGGAPLLEVESAGTNAWRAIMPANGPGTHDLIVQTADACLVAPAAYTCRMPALHVEDGEIHAESRDGDTFFVGAGRVLLAAGTWTPQGKVAVDPSALFGQTMTIVCDSRGRGAERIAAGDQFTGTIYLQAIVVPRGTAREEHLGRWTLPVEYARYGAAESRNGAGRGLEPSAQGSTLVIRTP